MSWNKPFKLTALTVIASFLFYTSAPSVLAASSEEPSIIQTFHEDVTGDGIKEKIRLKGDLLSKDTTYYQNLMLDIRTNDGQKFEFPLGGGYHPEVSFIDLNHDGVNNIFFAESSSSSKEDYPYKAFSVKNGQLKELPKPALPFVKGDFSNKFKVNLQLDPSEQPISIDLSKNAQKYIDTGIYDQSGQLTKDPASISTGSISKIESVFLGKQQGYALRSFLPVNGASKDDQLGSIETLWYLQDGQWQNLQTQWRPK